MSKKNTSIQVAHNPEKKRFEATVDGHLAVVEYIAAADRLVFSHTEVAKELEGKGVAGQVARAALEYAKEQKLKVLPICPYMAGYIRRHPEWKELLLPGYRVD